jgi:hypothetical protein
MSCTLLRIGPSSCSTPSRADNTWDHTAPPRRYNYLRAAAAVGLNQIHSSDHRNRERLLGSTFDRNKSRNSTGRHNTSVLGRSTRRHNTPVPRYSTCHHNNGLPRRSISRRTRPDRPDNSHCSGCIARRSYNNSSHTIWDSRHVLRHGTGPSNTRMPLYTPLRSLLRETVSIRWRAQWPCKPSTARHSCARNRSKPGPPTHSVQARSSPQAVMRSVRQSLLDTHSEICISRILP